MKEKVQNIFPSTGGMGKKCPHHRSAQVRCLREAEQWDQVQPATNIFDTADIQKAKQIQLFGSINEQTSSTMPVPIAVSR